MRILYITKLRESNACGVTNAVVQLLNNICEYADVSWLDLGEGSYHTNERLNLVKSEQLIQKKYDIAVFEDPFASLKFVQISKLLIKNRTPYILCPHGCFHKLALKHHALKKKIAMNTILRGYLSNCAAVQYLTENEKQNSLYTSRTIIIPNGIETVHAVSEKRKVKKIVFIARKTVWTKGIDLLLKASEKNCELLRRNGVRLFIYGSKESDKEEQQITEFISKNRIEDVVVNCGPIFGAEKRKVLESADIYIQTSRHEGFPMSILEALSFGVPVAITKETNLGELVEENHCGFICDANVESITRMIFDILQSCDIYEMSKNAVEFAKNYTWGKISEQTITIYKDLLNDISKQRDKR